MTSRAAWLALTASAAPALTDAAHFDFRVRAMTVLLMWSLANLVVGGVGAGVVKAKGLRIFFGANAAWNVVNLAIAAGGLYSAWHHVEGSLVGLALMQEVDFFQNVLLVNVGLDVGYVGAGLVTWRWGVDRADPWRSSIGLALVVQGVFLFGFDLILSLMVGDQLAGLGSTI